MRWAGTGSLAFVSAASVGLVALATISAKLTVLYLVACAPAILALLLRRLFNRPWLSPTTVLAIVLSAVAALGYAFQGLLEAHGGLGTSYSRTLDSVTAVHTVELISLAGCSTVVGSAVTLWLARARGVLDPPKPAGTAPGLLFAAAAVPPVLGILGAGVQDFFSRSEYLSAVQGSVLGSVASPLCTAGILVAGGLAATTHGSRRAAAVVLALLNLSVLFAASSRLFALAPILFALGYLVSGRSRSGWALLPAGALGFALLPLPLLFRGQAAQGLFPNLQAAFALDWGTVDWVAPISNLLVTFPIIGASAFGGADIHPSDLLVSLNPISGNSAGWYDVSRRLRLNLYTPTAGIGEVGALGPIVTIVFFVALGVTLAWFERALRRRTAEGDLVWTMLLVGLTTLFTLDLIEYNLRSGVRLLLYAAIAELARRGISAVIGYRERGARSAVLPSDQSTPAMLQTAEPLPTGQSGQHRSG